MTRFTLPVPATAFSDYSAMNQAAGGLLTPTFVASVAAGNLFEIESSKLALDRTQSDRIKGIRQPHDRGPRRGQPQIQAGRERCQPHGAA